MKQVVRLKDFEGPLDLLLHLIGKAKIDIQEIFVSEITQQYISTIQEAEDINMDEASEFLTMAAILIELKSRTLLPKPKIEEEEEDSQEAFIRRLEEYKRFKETAAHMQDFEKAAALMYQKLPEEYPLPPPTFEISGLTLDGLMEAIERILVRKPSQEEIEPFHREIRRDEYTVHGCMTSIMGKLKKGRVEFDSLLSQAPTKQEVVTLFLALLEVLRLGKAHILQEEIFETITLIPGRRKKLGDTA
ncbi:MAG: segregation/condensation protein A [Clostridiales bacterium]|nr:segregation/condensation protein A [Clostridiales bacterium]